MSREMSNYNFSVENIEEIAFASASGCMAAAMIEGEDLGDIVTVEFTHAGGPTIVNAPFYENTGTSITVFSEDLVGETITDVTIIDSDDNETAVEWTGAGVNPVADLVSVASNEPDALTLTGTNMIGVYSVVLEFTTAGTVTVQQFQFADQDATTVELVGMPGGDTLEEVTVRDECGTFGADTGANDTLTGLSILVDN